MTEEKYITQKTNLFIVVVVVLANISIYKKAF